MPLYLTEATREQILTLLREGEYPVVIARRCGVSPGAVVQHAKRNGMPYKRIKKGQFAPDITTKQVQRDDEYRKRRASLRWGYQLGQGRW